MPQWIKQLKSWFLFFLIVPFAFLVFHIIKRKRNSARKLNLPVTPSKLPIIGNLHQLGNLPHHTLQSLAQRCGPLLLIHLGQRPTLIVTSADVAKEIMKSHDHIFSSRPPMSIAEKLFYGKDIAFQPYGEDWRQLRRICIVQLLSQHKVESFKTVREEETSLMVQRIESSCSRSEVVNLSEMLISFTNDVICKVALGRKFHEDEGGRKMLGELQCLLGVFNVGDFVPWLAWVNHFNGLNKRIAETSRYLDCFLEGVIQEHIKSREHNESGDQGVKDLVDVLLDIENDRSIGVSFGRDNTKALILDMFSAGTDTSYATLEWAMAELVKHPNIMKELQTEIHEVTWPRPSVSEDDLEQMNYLRMVIKETLRLHPPAPLLVHRESSQQVKIQGYDIPAKTRVIINAWAIGRDPKSWEEPEAFEPKRFLTKAVDYRGRDFELIPFGAGRRGCPGINFTVPLVELALANLLYHFDWEMPDGRRGKELDMSEKFGLTMHRKEPLLLAATPRCC